MVRKQLTAKQFSELSTGIRLSSHEKICAERMEALQNSINELKKEVKSLRQDVSKGKGAVSALILIGSFIAALIGYFSFDGT
jgi:uncharacterized membrane protein YraQ (UPF0718 family)